MPYTEIILRDLAPELSEQLTTAATGKPKELEGSKKRFDYN
jgi:hypothetical protein